MLDDLVFEKTTLFVEHTTFLCDCFKSIKAWKIVILGFVKKGHGILELIKCLKRKKEKILHHMHEGSLY